MHIINFEKNYNYNVFMNDAIKLSRMYSPFLRIDTIGKSVEGREIPIIRLGFGHISVIYSAGVHGRENINPVVLLKIAENIAFDYFINRNTIFKDYSIVFIPLINPDGFEIAANGYSSIKNCVNRLRSKSTLISFEEYKYNARAVDINRNFPCKLYKASAFSGKQSASEPETCAFINFIKNEKSIGYIDFHSRGKSIYYYRNKMNKYYNENQYIIAKELAKSTGYKLNLPGEEIAEGDLGGNTVHFYSEYTNMPSFTIETIDDSQSFPLDAVNYSTTLKEIGHLPMDFLNIVC